MEDISVTCPFCHSEETFMLTDNPPSAFNYNFQMYEAIQKCTCLSCHADFEVQELWACIKAEPR